MSAAWKVWATAFPPAALLFILPFPGTVSLRLLLLAITFVLGILAWRRSPPPPLPGKLPLALWIGVALVSVALSFDPAYSLGEVKNEIGYTMLAFVGFYALAQSEQQVRRIGAGLLSGAVLMLGGALLTQSGPALWDERSLLGGSGGYATYLLTIAPLLLAPLLGKRSYPAAAAVFVLFLLAGYLAGQKISLVVTALQLVLLLLLLGRAGLIRLKWKWLVALAAAALIVMGGMLLQILNNRAFSDDPVRDNVVRDVRVRQWPKVMERVLAQPLTGQGFGRDAMRRAYPDLVPQDFPLFWHAHNVFLNYGISMGLPGMLALVLVFGSLLRQFWRLTAGGPPLAQVIGAAGFAMVAGVVVRNFTNDFFIRDLSLLFWSLTGLLLGLGLRLNAGAAEPRAEAAGA